MLRWQLTLSIAFALSTTGCIRGACDWGGCDDLGDGVCVWYEGARADVVYLNPDRYEEHGCNTTSATYVLSDAKRILQEDPFIILAERHIGFADYKPAGWGDESDPRPTGTYYWVVDKSAADGRAPPNLPYSITFGPFDSLGFIDEVRRRGIDQVLADSLLAWEPVATP